MLMILSYFLLLVAVYTVLRGYPNGPYLLANGFWLFLSLPCAIAYFFIYKDSSGNISFGSYSLSANTYLFVYYFQIASLLSSLSCYKIGFRYGLRHPAKSLYIVDEGSRTYRLVTFFVLIFSIFILLYVHSVFGFELLLDPRRLYEASRSDYGLHFFLLGVALRLGVLLVLLSSFYHKKKIIFLLILFSVFTGAKINTQVIVLFVVAYYILFYRNGSIGFKHFILLGMISLPVIYLLISLTFKGSEADIFLLLVSYINEPWNNFSLLVQSFDQNFSDFFYGLLTLENNFVSHIPRPLFPDKPYLFGLFRLADQYFPEVVSLGIGAPSFGTEGIAFADFGVAGLFFLIITRGVIAWVLGRISCILTRDQANNGSGNFIYFGFMMVFSDLYFLTLPPSNPLLDNLIVILLLSVFFGIKKSRVKFEVSSERVLRRG